MKVQYLRFPGWHGICRLIAGEAMKTLTKMIHTTGTRRVTADKTRVVVFEEGIMLTAIVMDNIRGTVRIPLGEVDRPESAAF